MPVFISNQAAPSRVAVPVEGTTAASSAVHRLSVPNGPGLTLTGPESRLSSGFSAASEVMGKLPSGGPTLIVLTTAPLPVDGAGTGNAYGSLAMTLLVRKGEPNPVVTAAVLNTVNSPSVLPTGLLLPSGRNGTEFTR